MENDAITNGDCVYSIASAVCQYFWR